MTVPRKICVVTGSRAEYGLLYWLLHTLASDPELTLQLVVTGAHLSPVFGKTVDIIRADGFTVDAEVEMLVAGDSPESVAKSTGLGVIGFTDTLARLGPDIVVLLGDRYEILAAAQTALLLGIPIAHVHGGERSEGALDEAIRHAVTKMSHLHFVAAPEYARRVIQLGEQPDRVFTVGALGLEHIKRMTFLDRNTLEERLDCDLSSPVMLVTYHPVTTDRESQDIAAGEIVRALAQFPTARIVITAPNADAGQNVIRDTLVSYAATDPARIAYRLSLGQENYLSLMKLADVVVGNSSSGIIEAPAIGVPTVNIGSRQRGRLRASSVIDCGDNTDAIVTAIGQALEPEFKRQSAAQESPYWSGNSAEEICKVLREIALDGLLFKSFHDLPEGAPV
jgi:UDP-N-acetylglucosamine 2-epimerase (non-hydrolysing)/GDP/UDP-N,N'-diacetylbacillosamine 2-epimerase (hydrolysing)